MRSVKSLTKNNIIRELFPSKPLVQSELNEKVSKLHDRCFSCLGFVITDPEEYRKNYYAFLENTPLPDSPHSPCYNATVPYNVDQITEPQLNDGNSSLSYFYCLDGTPRKVTIKKIDNSTKVEDHILPEIASASQSFIGTLNTIAVS